MERESAEKPKREWRKNKERKDLSENSEKN